MAAVEGKPRLLLMIAFTVTDSFCKLLPSPLAFPTCRVSSFLFPVPCFSFNYGLMFCRARLLVLLYAAISPRPPSSDHSSLPRLAPLFFS